MFCFGDIINVEEGAGVVRLYLLTSVLGFAVVSVCVLSELDGPLPDFSLLTNAIGTLVAFLISARFASACDRANSIISNIRLAHNAFGSMNICIDEWNAQPGGQKNPISKVFMNNKNILKRIKEDVLYNRSAIHDYVFEQILSKIRNGADTISSVLWTNGDAMSAAVATAKSSYHNGMPPQYNMMMTVLLVCFYGILAPLAAVSEFGFQAVYVTGLVSAFNFYVLHATISMHKPELSRINL